MAENQNFRLLRDDVYVEILDALPSDIIIMPDFYMDLPVMGRVLAVGPGKRTKKNVLLKPGVEVGEVIRFYFGGVQLHYPDKRHAIVQHDFIQGIVQGWEPSRILQIKREIVVL